MKPPIKFPIGKKTARDALAVFESLLEKAETDSDRDAIKQEIRKFILRLDLLKMVLEEGFDPKEFLVVERGEDIETKETTPRTDL